MKKFTYPLISLLMLIGVTLSFASCGDDYGPYPGPPGGQTFIDSDLTGNWQLYQANGVNVSPGDVNYMQFNGYGNGRYYYMSNGRWYYEGISYWCKAYNSGTYELNIQYANGSSASMDYWFASRNDLFMRWTTYQGQTILYHYVYTSRLP